VRLRRGADGADTSALRRALAGRHLALAGFMGVGKTSVGRLLAAELGRPFVDTDPEAEAIAGRSIVECFRAGDEAGFREAEARAVRRALDGEVAVIALGGGAMLREDSRALLLARSVVVFLHVPWSEMEGWLPEMVAARPLLQGRTLEEVERLYRSRVDVYEQAHVRVSIPRTGAEDAARCVLHALRSGQQGL
jgi:shikimate kinase